jgi:hypothetical protein
LFLRFNLEPYLLRLLTLNLQNWLLHLILWYLNLLKKL